jgi:hypothetical protein
MVIGFASLDLGTANCAGDAEARSPELVGVNEVATNHWMQQVGVLGVEWRPQPSLDPIRDYFARMLECPARLVEESRKSRRGVSLDSMCNP